MHVGAKHGQDDYLGSLSDCGATKVIAEEVARGAIDHGLPIARRPREMDIDLVGGHGRAWGVESSQSCSMPKAWARHCTALGSTRSSQAASLVVLQHSAGRAQASVWEHDGWRPSTGRQQRCLSRSKCLILGNLACSSAVPIPDT